MSKVRIIESTSSHYGKEGFDLGPDHPLVLGHPQDDWREHWEVFVWFGDPNRLPHPPAYGPTGFLEREVERLELPEL
jgi:hypothetical protein